MTSTITRIWNDNDVFLVYYIAIFYNSKFNYDNTLHSLLARHRWITETKVKVTWYFVIRTLISFFFRTIESITTKKLDQFIYFSRNLRKCLLLCSFFMSIFLTLVFKFEYNGKGIEYVFWLTTLFSRGPCYFIIFHFHQNLSGSFAHPFTWIT